MRRLYRWVILVGALLVVLALRPGAAWTCSCLTPIPTPVQSLFIRDAVFSGVINSTTVDPCGYRHLMLDITRVWQGVDSCQMEVVTTGCGSSDCGVSCSIGVEVIIYADWTMMCSDSVLFTTLCEGSALWGPYHESQLGGPGGGQAFVEVNRWGGSGNQPGEFDFPSGTAAAGDGSVYVSDYANHRIQKFTSAGSYILSWGSFGTADGEFSYPWEIAVGPDGTVYVIEGANVRVQRFSPLGGFLGKWGTAGTGNGQFLATSGIAVNDSGYVYVSDLTLDRVQKFASDGTWLTSWGQNGTSPGEFVEARDIAVDKEDNVYVVDSGRIQRFTSQGTFIAEYDTLCGYDQMLTGIYSLTTDANGYLYIALDQRILKVDRNGTVMTGWSAPNTLGLAASSNGDLIYSITHADEVVVWGPRTTVTAVEPEVHKTIELRTFPNPFNSSVTFQYTTRELAGVGVVIYDVLGRKLRDLSPGVQDPGVHILMWHGLDDLGVPVSSGIYFVKLTHAGESVTQKLVLLK